MAEGKHLFGLDGDEVLHFDPGTVLESQIDDWRDDWDLEPDHIFYVLEWDSAPVRSFIKSADTIDHLIEYQMEEYGDEDGMVYEKLEARAKDAAVIAAFDDAIDLLFKGVTYCWAQNVVATHEVALNRADPSNPLYDGEPFWRRA